MHVTQRHDRYAAAILAEACLYRIGDPLLETHASEADRAQWRLVQNTLREAQRTARSQWRMASELDAYHDKFQIYSRLLAALEGDPVAHVRRYKAAHHATLRRLPAVACALTFALAVGTFWAAASPLVLGLAVAFTLAFAASGVWLTKTRARSHAALEELRDAWARAHAYATFMDDPAGGQWLQRVWERHPLLLEQAPRPAKPKSGVVRIQRDAAASRPRAKPDRARSITDACGTADLG